MSILKKEHTRHIESEDKKYALAMCLLEAFSTVDEKYLAVCGAGAETEPAAGRKSGLYFVRGYGRAAAALLAILTGITVTAAVYQGWDERLIKYFNSPSEEMQNKTVAEGVVNTQQASAEDKGITISIIQTVHDEKRICMLLEVAAPEAQLSDDFWFSRIELLTEDGRDINRGVGEMKVSAKAMPSAEPGMRRWSYYIDIRREISLTMESLVLRLKGCEVIAPREQKVIDGEWVLPLQLTDVSRLSRVCQCDREIKRKDGSAAHVKEIRLTPMTVKIIYEEDNLQTDKAYAPSAILDKEGNVLSEVGDWSVSSAGIADGQLERMLDVEQAYAVCIGEDTEILLKTE